MIEWDNGLHSHIELKSMLSQDDPIKSMEMLQDGGLHQRSITNGRQLHLTSLNREVGYPSVNNSVHTKKYGYFPGLIRCSRNIFIMLLYGGVNLVVKTVWLFLDSVMSILANSTEVIDHGNNISTSCEATKIMDLSTSLETPQSMEIFQTISSTIEVEKVAEKQGIGKSIREIQVKHARENVSDMWADPDTSSTQIRSLTYMIDSKKNDAGATIGKLIHLDVLSRSPSSERFDHIALWEKKRPHSILNFFQKKHPEVNIFIVNFQVPQMHKECVVCYWALPKSSPAIKDSCNFYKLFDKFINQTDDYRSKRFKLIPQIIDGPLLVKGAITQRPALTGKKFTHRYFKGDNYFEVDMDLGSSVIASQIVSLCSGYCTKLVVDVSFLIQGEHEEELPEKIIGSVRFNHLNLKEARQSIVP